MKGTERRTLPPGPPCAPGTEPAAGGESDGEGNRNCCSVSHTHSLSSGLWWKGFRRSGWGLIFENAEGSGGGGGLRKQPSRVGRGVGQGSQGQAPWRWCGGVVLCACVSWTGDGGDEQGGLFFRGRFADHPFKVYRCIVYVANPWIYFYFIF